MIDRGDIRGYRVGVRLIRVDLDEVDAAMKPIPSASTVASKQARS